MNLYERAIGIFNKNVDPNLAREIEPVLIPYQEDSTATTIAALKEDFNTLLAGLIAAGLMEEAPEEEEEAPEEEEETPSGDVSDGSGT